MKTIAAARRPGALATLPRLVAVAICVSALVTGILVLLPTSVPGDLSLPPVDVEQVFDPELVTATRRYERVFYVDWLLGQAALLFALALYARHGAAYIRESAAGPIGSGLFLGMLGLTLAWLAQVPFRLVLHWWARQEGTSRASHADWAFGALAQLAVELLILCALIAVVMGLALRLGEWWWPTAAGALVAVVGAGVMLYPLLDRGTHALPAGPLSAAGDRYERQLGTGDLPVRIRDVDGDTVSAQAIAQGLGPTRRIVFWETFLREPFSLREQQVTLAHEVAHHARNHNLRGIAWFTVFIFPAAWIVMRATRRAGGMGAPQAVPLALLVVALLYTVAMPAANWISRRMETEAEWQALEVSRDPAAATQLMVHAAETSYADPAPPYWARILYGTHPTLAQRVALARAWSQRHSRP